LTGGAALVEKTTGRLLVRGADRRAYLQGLLTNDIAALVPGTGCYAAMLTAQGRMITDMRVLELGDAILLDLPASTAAPVKDHLERFVFSEDVQIEDVTGGRAELGVYGLRARDVLSAVPADGGLPADLHASTRLRIAGVDAVAVAGADAGVAGYDVIVDRADAEPVRLALQRAGAVPASAADVETVRVERGVPLFGADMDSETIPLEAGIEDRAISRSKGCYVGQEVIVRVQDRGHGRVARRLAGLTFDALAPIPSSATIVRAGDREIGRVTSAVWSPALARPIALAYVHRDFAEAGTHVTVAGADAVVAALPFV
jgi:folate-binding protein YgfZ